jgi:hypothetical protein
MSVQDTMPPAAAAPPACPRWCHGDHTGDYAETHRAEVGRVDEGELALIVAIVEPVDGSKPPTIELSWRDADPSCNDHWLMEALELEPSEIAPFGELIGHAATMLTRIGQCP